MNNSAYCSFSGWIYRAALGLLVAGSWPCFAGVIVEGFDDDFLAGRAVPDTVDVALSSGFSRINEKRPAASGLLTLRDRDILDPGGLDGGFVPLANVALDFSDGLGSFVTWRINGDGGGLIVPGSFVDFSVVRFGGDGGQLFKFVSTDGVNFQQVGNDSDAMGVYQFALPAGGTSAYFRLQVGNRSIFDGIWIDDVVLATPEPTHLGTVGAGLLGLGTLLAHRWRRRFLQAVPPVRYDTQWASHS